MSVTMDEPRAARGAGATVDTDTLLEQLTFERSVRRSLVHREALSEVFLTDYAGDADRFAVAAQLPSSHAYYTDHRTRPATIDPLLVLECCRQAETLGVHAFLGAPEGTKFLLHEWSVDLPPTVAATGPTRLVIDVRPRPRWAGSRLRGASYAMEVLVDGTGVGSVTMTVSYVPESSYEAVRTKGRGSTPPLSSAVRPTDGGMSLCEPAIVGRRSPHNVLLLAPQVVAGTLSAHALAAVDHPSLFDHAQDHVPGMTVMEVARQAATLSAAEFGFAEPDGMTVAGLEAEFRSYTELDRPTRVRAERPYRDGARCVVDVELEQETAVTAAVRVHLERHSPAH